MLDADGWKYQFNAKNTTQRGITTAVLYPGRRRTEALSTPSLVTFPFDRMSQPRALDGRRKEREVDTMSRAHGCPYTYLFVEAQKYIKNCIHKSMHNQMHIFIFSIPSTASYVSTINSVSTTTPFVP